MKLRTFALFTRLRMTVIVAAAGLAGLASFSFLSAQTPTAPKAAATSAKPQERLCANCGKAISTGTACESCTTKLMIAQNPAGTTQKPAGTAQTITVGTGDRQMIMASNDMMKPDASFVYTLDNDPQRNSVAVYRRGANGSLMQLAGSPFNAGGRGLTGGDIDEQGALRSAGKYILAVNPGSDTIAVLEKTSRGLLHVEGSPFPSGGSTPLSLAVHGDMVYVANQAAEFASPKSLPNITGFRLKEGRLIPVPGAMAELPKGMGPAQVEFSANGRVLS